MWTKKNPQAQALEDLPSPRQLDGQFSMGAGFSKPRQVF
jgi:hypothetical protein